MRVRLTASLAFLAAAFAFCPHPGHAQQTLSARMDRMAGPETAAKGGGGGGSVGYAFQAAPAAAAGTASPQTYNAVGIGTAAANRYVLICIATSNNGYATAVTIGGVSATKAVETDDNNIGIAVELWYANVPTGTTATVKVTTLAPFPNSMIIATATINTATPAPSSQAIQPWGFRADPQITSSAVTIPSNGVGVFCGASTKNAPTITYNTGTKDSNVSGPSTTAWDLTMGHNATAGSWTPSYLGAGSSGTLAVAAAWGP